MIRWIRRIVYVACAVLVATAFLPLLPVNWWWVRIGDYPRVQLLIAYLIALGVVVTFRREVTARAMILLLATSTGIQLFWIFEYLPVAPTEVEWAESDDRSVRIRVLTANVLQDNTNSDALLALIEQHDADVVVLCEVNERWIRDLRALEDTYAYSLTHPLENTYGMAFYSNLEVAEADVRNIVRDDVPSIDARVILPSGHRVRMFAVHPNPPRPGEDTTNRDAELVLVGREVRDDASVIVLGDMNDVGWSSSTDLFQEVSQLLDPRKGRGMYATFNAKSWIWRYPLDHVFHSDDFRLARLETLPFIGSDHFPLLIELSHEPAARDEQEAPALDAGDAEDAQDAVDEATSDNE